MENFATFLSIVSIVVSVVTYVITIKPNLKSYYQAKADLEQFRNDWRRAQISQNPNVELSILIRRGNAAMANNYMNLKPVRVMFHPRLSQSLRELGSTLFYYTNQIESNRFDEGQWETVCEEVGQAIGRSFRLLAASPLFVKHQKPKKLHPAV